MHRSSKFLIMAIVSVAVLEIHQGVYDQCGKRQFVKAAEAANSKGKKRGFVQSTDRKEASGLW